MVMMCRAQAVVLLVHVAMGQVPTHPGKEFIQQYAGSFKNYIPGHEVVETPSPVILAEARPGQSRNLGDQAGWGLALRSADDEKTGSRVTQIAGSSNSWSGSSGHGDLNFGPDHEYMQHGMHLGKTKGDTQKGSNAHSSQDSSQKSFDYQKYTQGSGQAGSGSSQDSSQKSSDYQKYMQGSGQAGSGSSQDSSQKSFDYQKYMQGSGQAGSGSSQDSSQKSFDYQKYMQGSGQTGSGSTQDSSQQSSGYQKFAHGPQKPAVADAYNGKDSSQQSMQHQHGSGKMQMGSIARSTEKSEKLEDAEKHLSEAEAARKHAAREIEVARQVAAADAASKRVELESKERHEDQVVKDAEDRLKHAEDMLKLAEAARKPDDRTRHVAYRKKEQAEHAAEDEQESKNNTHDIPKATILLAAGHGMKSQYLVPEAFLLLSGSILATLACSVSYYVKCWTSQAAQPGILEEGLLPEEDGA